MDERMTTEKAAAYLGLSTTWLNRERSQGRGPRFVRLGNRVFYRRADLDKFIEGSVTETEQSRRAAS